MNDELNQRIADDLATYHDRNEIILMVCEQAGVEWPQA